MSRGKIVTAAFTCTMTPNILTYPQTIEISELFRIREGKIDRIEAVIHSVSYSMKSEVWVRPI
ncbi:MAG: hypothetical protein JW793_12020 [Acidobacteria bacterium]|nr:hypothetical protein [Acidobacteriota bacterium]